MERQGVAKPATPVARGMALVGDERERGYEELELARVQMDRDEERLAKIMSDFDMLCTHRDALARACQVNTRAGACACA